MKKAYKAALMSAFLFPGSGQFYLKRYWQGLIIMGISIAGVAYIVWQATIKALSITDSSMLNVQQGGNVDIQGITAMLNSKDTSSSPYGDIILFAIICCWIYAIIDAYLSGKEEERHNSQG
jgi:TM2 domain-containing membrane protein YozV